MLVGGENAVSGFAVILEKKAELLPWPNAFDDQDASDL
jgi:hypothetical protein